MKINKGYTLLFAVLLTSVVLSIAMSILTIARKEVILSSGARESFAAVYIADGAIDCAIFNDRFSNAFHFDATQSETIDCGQQDNGEYASTPITRTDKGTYIRYTFNIVGTDATDLSPCATVTVDRYISPQKTIIESRGYNVGYNSGANPPDCSLPHPKKVERAFRYSYTN